MLPVTASLNRLRRPTLQMHESPVGRGFPHMGPGGFAASSRVLVRRNPKNPPGHHLEVGDRDTEVEERREFPDMVRSGAGLRIARGKPDPDSIIRNPAPVPPAACERRALTAPSERGHTPCFGMLYDFKIAGLVAIIPSSSGGINSALRSFLWK